MTPAAPLITRKEWNRVAGFALFVVALTTLPYLLAWSQQTPDRIFAGALFGAEDANSYLAKMRIGWRGEWAFSLFYTPEPTTPEYGVFLPYIAAGQIVRLFVTDPAQTPAALLIAYQVMRITFDAVLILALYRFIAHFTAHERVRYNALALACLGGGLGWITAVFPITTAAMPDLTIPEGFTFLILYGLPHLALARAALLTGLAALIVADDARLSPSDGSSLRRGVMAGVLFNIVGLCVPFYMAVIYAVLGFWGLAAWAAHRRFPWALFVRAVLAAALTLPLLIYTALIFTRNPAFAQWSAQNLLFSPPPWEYALAYAPLAMCAALAVRHFWRSAQSHIAHALLIGWLAGAPILVYLPINVQRRLAEGVIVPLAILAAWGIRQWIWRDQAGTASPPVRKGNTVRTLFVLMFLCATTVLWISTGALAGLVKADPTYRDGAELRAFAWMQANTWSKTNVLAAWATGNAIPVYTDLRPFVGLGPETLLAEAKEAQTIAYFRDMLTPAERAALYESPCTAAWITSGSAVELEPCRITYVFWGRHERALWGDTPIPDVLNWQNDLTPIYQDGGVTVYEVNR
ncbi:MAG: hypothetical protein SF162_09545 [bacterium]|nr:hypothetical protein [bacterium]